MALAPFVARVTLDSFIAIGSVVMSRRYSKSAAQYPPVVAGLAEQLIVARAPGDGVVADAAEQARPRQSAVGLVKCDDVVTASAEHLDQAGVGDRRRATDDGDNAAVDRDRAGGVAADRDVVVEIQSTNFATATDSETPSYSMSAATRS